MMMMSFILIPFFRRCPLAAKLTSFILNISKSCMLRPLALTKLIFLVKYSHVPCT
ncbi:hypothetical protein Hanom_Chr17g01589581 [Helianthus anomalus]